MQKNVLDFGAKGDGTSNDTDAIQKTIEACGKEGGGRVVIPGGRVFRSGSLILPSHVELYLESGAVLKASDNAADFRLFEDQKSRDDTVTVPVYMNSDYSGRPGEYFIYSYGTTDVTISGRGTIDGNESIFYGEESKWQIDGKVYPRMPLLFLENVRNLNICDVTLTRSAFWTVHMVGCRDVLIEGVRILNNLRMVNCDGIDPDHCSNVRITGCHIESADDCIVFKTTESGRKYGPCENITVSGCTLISTSAALKIGTESVCDIRNINVTGCCISRSNRGISVQLRDEGNVENINFSDISIETRRFSKHWWGEGEPVALTCVGRHAGKTPGRIRNINFTNINCTGENGIFIYGSEESRIEDIHFENVSLQLESVSGFPKDRYDLRPYGGQDSQSVKDGILQCRMAGVYARFADRVTVRDLRLSVNENIRAAFGEPADTYGCRDFICCKGGDSYGKN